MEFMGSRPILENSEMQLGQDEVLLSEDDKMIFANPFADDLKKELISYLKFSSVEHGDFILTTGSKSSIYFDTSHVVQTNIGLNIIGQLLANKILNIEGLRQCRVDALGAVQLNGIPIALAGTITTQCPTIILDPDGFSYRGFKAAPTGNIIIIEDVLQSGVSVCKAIHRARQSGYNVLATICLLDREEGGIQKIWEETQTPVFPIVKKTEIISINEELEEYINRRN
jgi:orotate phosphoribosyltransferase